MLGQLRELRGRTYQLYLARDFANAEKGQRLLIDDCRRTIGPSHELTLAAQRSRPHPLVPGPRGSGRRSGLRCGGRGGTLPRRARSRHGPRAGANALRLDGHQAIRRMPRLLSAEAAVAGPGQPERFGSRVGRDQTGAARLDRGRTGGDETGWVNAEACAACVATKRGRPFPSARSETSRRKGSTCSRWRGLRSARCHEADTRGGDAPRLGVARARNSANGQR